MVSHCANPLCARSFRSLKQGRLVVLPPLRKSVSPEGGQPTVAWLCEECASSFDVIRDDDGRVQVVRSRAAAA